MTSNLGRTERSGRKEVEIKVNGRRCSLVDAGIHKKRLRLIKVCINETIPAEVINQADATELPAAGK